VLPRGLYTEPGFVEEITAIEKLINSGKISESYLATLRSTHSIANSIVNVLSSHDSVIPQNLYDHFMSPLAKLDELMDDLVNKDPFFEVVMQHLRFIIGNKTVKISCGEMAANVGIFILRAAEDDSGIDSHSFEMQSRVKTFEKMLQSYIRGKEEADSFFASANTTFRKSPGLNVPLAFSQSAESLGDFGASASAEVADAGGKIAQFSPASSPVPPREETIQERSVKVVFSNPSAKPTQDELTSRLSVYGTVVNVSY
jgi:hypothetical protein